MLRTRAPSGTTCSTRVQDKNTRNKPDKSLCSTWGLGYYIISLAILDDPPPVEILFSRKHLLALSSMHLSPITTTGPIGIAQVRDHYGWTTCKVTIRVAPIDAGLSRSRPKLSAACLATAPNEWSGSSPSEVARKSFLSFPELMRSASNVAGTLARSFSVLSTPGADELRSS